MIFIPLQDTQTQGIHNRLLATIIFLFSTTGHVLLLILLLYLYTIDHNYTPLPQQAQDPVILFDDTPQTAPASSASTAHQEPVTTSAVDFVPDAPPEQEQPHVINNVELPSSIYELPPLPIDYQATTMPSPTAFAAESNKSTTKPAQRSYKNRREKQQQAAAQLQNLARSYMNSVEKEKQEQRAVPRIQRELEQWNDRHYQKKVFKVLQQTVNGMLMFAAQGVDTDAQCTLTIDRYGKIVSLTLTSEFHQSAITQLQNMISNLLNDKAGLLHPPQLAPGQETYTLKFNIHIQTSTGLNTYHLTMY